jgi:RimJ/RimL family protein N-acetyltransferase
VIIENFRLVTPRLRLIPATVATVRAEMSNHKLLGDLLQARIPSEWPPEQLREALPYFLDRMEAKPFGTGWFGWYGVLPASYEMPGFLIASAGFMGEPVDGVAKVGYSVLPEFQRQGYATEIVGALLRWSQQQLEAPIIEAETDEDNLASRRVLEKLSFTQIDSGGDTTILRYRWNATAKAFLRLSFLFS